MLDDVLYLTYDNNEFCLVSHNESSSNPLMVFYNPDNPAHLDLITHHTDKETVIIALASKDTKNTLPKNATALIHCDNAHTTTQAILNSLSAKNTPSVKYEELKMLCKGHLYHHQFTANGDGAIKTITKQIPTQINNKKAIHTVIALGCDGEKFLLNELGYLDEAMLLAMDLDLDHKHIWAFCFDKKFADRVIVDIFYNIA